MDERVIENLMTDIYSKLDEIPLLKQKIENWMETTKDYRTQLCGKIEDIKDNCKNNIGCLKDIDKKVNELPCKERSGWYKSITRQVGFMWLVLSIILVSVVGIGIHSILAK